MRGFSGRPGIGLLCEGGHLDSRLRGVEVAWLMTVVSFVAISPIAQLSNV